MIDREQKEFILNMAHKLDNLEADYARLRAAGEALWAKLNVLLDMVDYTSGACSLGEPVGAVLPVMVIKNAKEESANWREAADGWFDWLLPAQPNRNGENE